MRYNAKLLDLIRIINLFNINFLLIIFLNSLKIDNYIVLIIALIIIVVLFSITQSYLIRKFGSNNLLSGQRVYFFIAIGINVLIFAVLIWLKQYMSLIIACCVLILYYLILKVLISKIFKNNTVKKSTKKRTTIGKEQMHDTEQKLLINLGALVTLGVFVFLLSQIMNSFGIQNMLFGNNLMEYYKNNDYSSIYKCYDENFNEQYFINEQNALNNILGDVNNYKYVGQAKYSVNGNNMMRIMYEVDYTNYRKIGLTWGMVKRQNHWKVINYKLDSDYATLSEISEKAGTDISFVIKMIEGNMDRFKVFAEKTLILLQKRDYEKIYSDFDNNLKKRGTQSEFIEYLKYAEKRYGKLESSKIDRCISGKNKNEVQLEYQCSFEKAGSVAGIVLWVKEDTGLFISGFKFIEGKW